MIRRWLAYPGTAGADIDAPGLVSVRRRLIRETAFLRRIYQEWYAAIAEALPSGEAPILELGSGGGFLEESVPGLITSELQPCSHVSLVADGHPWRPR